MRLIDADELLNQFRDEPEMVNGQQRMGYAVGVGYLRDTINAAPTIEAEPIKRGRWIVRKGAIECSVCKAAFLNYWEDQDKMLFSPWVSCPLCGAKMETPE